MRAGASHTVQRLRVWRRWLRRTLNTRTGMMAFFGGMCLGVLLSVCWLLLVLRFDVQADRIALSAAATVLGLSVLLPASLVLVFYFLPISPPLTAYTPPRATILRLMAAFALYTLLVMILVFAIGGLFHH